MNMCESKSHGLASRRVPLALTLVLVLAAPPAAAAENLASLQQEVARLQAVVSKLQEQVEALQANRLPVVRRNADYIVEVPGNLQFRVERDLLLEGNNANIRARQALNASAQTKASLSAQEDVTVSGARVSETSSGTFSISGGATLALKAAMTSINGGRRPAAGIGDLTAPVTCAVGGPVATCPPAQISGPGSPTLMVP